MVCVTSILIVDDDKVKPCIEDDDDDDDEDEDDDDDDDDDDEYEYEYESIFFNKRSNPIQLDFSQRTSLLWIDQSPTRFCRLRTSTRLKRGDFSPHRPATTWWWQWSTQALTTRIKISKMLGTVMACYGPSEVTIKLTGF